MPQDQEELQVTSASEWGHNANVADDSFITELPSGNVARVRRSMNMLNLLQKGFLPNPLGEIVRDMVAQKVTDIPEDKQTPELIAQFGKMLDDIAIDTMVEPKLDRPPGQGEETDKFGVLVNPKETDDEYHARLDKWKPAEGCLSVWQIDVGDKMYLFALAQGAAADAKSFRLFQAESVEDVPDVPKPPVPTKRTGGTGGRPKKK